MNKTARIIAAKMIALGLISGAYAADNHQVTVQVHEISKINVTGGNILLEITTESGGVPVDATNTDCSLDWMTNKSTKKVTVQTSNASPTYTLKVLCAKVSKGISAGTVKVSTRAQNVVTDVKNGLGGCVLIYTASATMEQEAGSDRHTVTYTITDAN